MNISVAKIECNRDLDVEDFLCGHPGEHHARLGEVLLLQHNGALGVDCTRTALSSFSSQTSQQHT